MQMMRMKISFYACLLLLVVLFASIAARAQEVEFENVPEELQTNFKLDSFWNSYDLDGSINPFYLRGDFDADGKPDYAFRIKSKANGKVGIAVWLSSQKKMTLLGAGVPFQINDYQESDLKAFNFWRVQEKGPVESGVEAGKPPRLIGEAILVGKAESASGLFYWTGKKFAWYQQGD